MIQKREKYYLKLWLPPIIWAAVIFLFSSYPTVATTEIKWQDFIVKKTFHIFEYAVFTMLFFRALKESGVEKKKAGIYSIAAALLYGITDEFHQSFTPGRDSKARDVVFDTIGGLLAIYVIWKQLPKAPKKLRNWAKGLQIL